MRKLSICVVTQQYASIFSGVGLYAFALITGLIADGHAVTVITPHDQIPSGADAITAVPVPAPRFAGSQARWLPLSCSFAQALTTAQYIHTFDLIHFTDARESLFCRWRCPAVGDVQDTYAAEASGPLYYRQHYRDWLTRWTYYRFVKLCEARAYPRLHALIANSQYTAGKIAAAYPLDAQRLFICYKTMRQDYWARALRLRDEIAPHPPRAIFVGGNLQRKGLPTLIAAVARLRDVLPDLEVWVVGADKVTDQMRDLCREFGAEAQFRFWGWQSQEDLIGLYAQADLFVMPSLTEGFGYVFLEAMAAGLPVIGSRAGGIAEVVEHGVNGMLVQPGDVEGLAQAVQQVLRDPGLAVQFRRAGLTTARQFDMSRMLACTYDVYNTVLVKASGPRSGQACGPVRPLPG